MIQRGNANKRNTDSATRALLVRKGNQFFNEGKYAKAEKIFVTVDYKDGMTRLGDYFLKQKDLYNACRMYFMADDQKKIDAFCEKAVNVLQRWLSEDETADKVAQTETADKILLKTN